MTATSRRELVERLTDGQLDAILADAPSLQAAHDTLKERYRVVVSTSTLSRWRDGTLTDPEPEAAS